MLGSRFAGPAYLIEEVQFGLYAVVVPCCVTVIV
jgi:hypothetical protein